MVSREARLITLLVIDATFFFVEIIVGYAVGSLALVADSFHMLNDVMSLIVAFYALKLSSRPDTTSDPRYSYGWQRAEILGALINGVFLLALCFSIFMEAIERFVNVTEVKSPKLVVIVGSLGLASNIVGLFLFHDHGHSHGGHSHGHSHGPSPATVRDAQSHSHSQGEGEAHSHDHTHTRENSSSSSSSTTAAAGINGDASGSRRRADSVGSLYGHPAQTRAYVVRAAHDMGYDNHPPASPSRDGGVKIQGGERDRLNSSNPGNYGSTDLQDQNLTDADVETGLSKGGKKSGVSKRKSWFFGKKTDVELEDDPEHSRGAEDHGHSHSHGGGGGGHGHSHDGSMNMRGVFLHVLGDALGNVGVIAAGLFIAYTDYWWRFYTDPAISFLITIIIFTSALPLVKSASFILLQGVPVTIPLEKVKNHLTELDGVISVHELHIWQLSESKIVASVHVLVDCDSGHNERYMDIAAKLRGILHQWGIHSATIQPEFVKGGIREAARISGVTLGRNGETDEQGRLVTEDGTLVESELSRGTACFLTCGPDANTPCTEAPCCPPPPPAPSAPASGRASPKSKMSNGPDDHEGQSH